LILEDEDEAALIDEVINDVASSALDDLSKTKNKRGAKRKEHLPDDCVENENPEPPSKIGHFELNAIRIAEIQFYLSIFRISFENEADNENLIVQCTFGADYWPDC
jgi:hypothetical protein